MGEVELIMILTIVIYLPVVIARYVTICIIDRSCIVKSPVDFQHPGIYTIPGLVREFMSAKKDCFDQGLFAIVAAGQIVGIQIRTGPLDVAIRFYFRDSSVKCPNMINKSGAGFECMLLSVK